ncbi:hypothetical protein MKX31_28265 [Bacillus sp. FSL M8-0063]|uniref:hypothetical protein n=1 Tax=Bacillus sp. FSL M8-0063 TaxID=2921566 RepID=UPI0030FA32C1
MRFGIAMYLGLLCTAGAIRYLDAQNLPMSIVIGICAVVMFSNAKGAFKDE